jgi:predicted nucleic acid-binding protein
MDRVFFDTNVLLDVLEARQPFLPASLAVLSMARTGKIKGATTGLSLAIIAYMKRKEAVDKVTSVLRELQQFIFIANLGNKEADYALAAGLPDFEDALQLATAIGWKASHLVTRNIRDFPQIDQVKVLSPTDYLELRRR